MPHLQPYRQSISGSRLRVYFAISFLFWCLASRVQAQSNAAPSDQSTPQAGSWEQLNQLVHSGTKGQALIGFLIGGLITYGLIRFLGSKNEPGEYKPIFGTLIALLLFGFATLIVLVRLLFIWP